MTNFIPFKPTHEICLEDVDGTRRMIAVMACDGAAYTQEEWYASSAAGWEVDKDGYFTCQGQTVPTGWKSVSVAKWKQRRGSWFTDRDGTYHWVPTEKLAHKRNIIGLTKVEG